jgi:hypothetical protein
MSEIENSASARQNEQQQDGSSGGETNDSPTASSPLIKNHQGNGNHSCKSIFAKLLWWLNPQIGWLKLFEMLQTKACPSLVTKKTVAAVGWSNSHQRTTSAWFIGFCYCMALASFCRGTPFSLLDTM